MAPQRRVGVLSEIAERVALWNEFRSDDFQDQVVRQVQAAREHWRGEGGELPPPGADPTFDALMGLAEVSDSSPIAVRDACAAAFRAADVARVPR